MNEKTSQKNRYPAPLRVEPLSNTITNRLNNLEERIELLTSNLSKLESNIIEIQQIIGL